MKKKILLACGAIILLVIAVLVMLPFVIDINDIVAQQIPLVEKAINRKVTIDNVRLTIITGLGAEVSGVEVSNRPGLKKESFAAIDKVALRVALLPLLSGQITVSSIAIVRPSVLIERTADGAFNFDDMKPAGETAAAPAPVAEAEQDSQDAELPEFLNKLELAKITIRGGGVRFFDGAGFSPPKETRIDELDLTLKSVSLMKRIALSLAADLYTDNKAGSLKITGYAGPVGTSLQPERIPVDITLQVQQLVLPALAHYLPGMTLPSGTLTLDTHVTGALESSIELKSELSIGDLKLALGEEQQDAAGSIISANGRMVLNGSLAGPLDNLNITGNLDLDDCAAAYGELFTKPAKTPLNAAYTVAIRTGVQEIKTVKLLIGQLALTASGNITNGSVFELKAETNTFSPVQLLKLSPQVKQSLAGELKLPEAAQLSAEASGPIDNLDVTAAVNMTDGTVSYGDLVQKPAGTPLTLHASALLKKDSVVVRTLNAVLGKVKISGTASVKNFQDPYINARVNVPPVQLADLAPLVPMLKPYKLRGSLRLDNVKAMGGIDGFSELKGISGRLSLQQAGATSAELQKSFTNIGAAVEVGNGAVLIKKVSATIGDSTVHLSGSLKNLKKPVISVRLTSPYLNIDSLLPTPAEGTRSKEDTPPAQPEDDQGPAVTELPDLTIDGTVKIAKGKYDKIDFKNLNLRCTYRPPVAAVKKLHVDIFNGSIDARGTVGLKDLENPEFDLDVKTENIDFNDVLTRLSGLEKALYGNFTGQVKLHGTGRDWPAIREGLTGNGSVNITKGKLKTINVLNAMGQSLLGTPGLEMLVQKAFPKHKDKINETTFKDLTGKVHVEAGKIKCDDVLMRSDDFVMKGNGLIGLDSSIDFEGTTTLSKRASRSLARDKTLKYLLNDSQQLEVPLSISGDLKRPKLDAQGKAVVKMLGGAAKKVIEDKAGEFLDKLFKK